MSNNVLQFKNPDKNILSAMQIQSIADTLRGENEDVENVSKPVNLDLNNAGEVLRLALVGKLVPDSNPTVLLERFRSLAKDIQS